MLLSSISCARASIRALGVLSNRTPTQSERSRVVPGLKAFLDLFPCEQVAALGRVAASQLENLNVETSGSCRTGYSASGGAKLFRQQIARIVTNLTSFGKAARNQEVSARGT